MPSIACRGGRTLDLPEGRTALIVIDMQVDFLEPSGRSAAMGRPLGLVRAIIPRVGRLLAWARETGMPVWHTREARKPGSPQGYPVIGSPGHALIEALAPVAGEPVIDKDAYSAFHGTDLDAQLRAAGVTHLILCGVTASCCVHATLRAAVDHEYSCLTVADCCASFELDDRDRALDLIAAEDHLLGDECDLAALVGPLERPLVEGISIRAMTDADKEAVMAIYAAGVAAGGATFETEPGTWDKFTASKRATPRLVAEDRDGKLQGYVVISPTSTRPVYRGICDIMIYVRAEAAGQGIGHALLSRMIEASEREGVWLLTAGIFPDNTASLLLHAAHGFRVRGRQAGAGQLQAGPNAGKWMDVLRLERRSETVGFGG